MQVIQQKNCEDMTLIKFLDLSNQYKGIKEEIDAAIEGILSTASFIGGEPVKNFESQFASFCEAKCCIGVGNGTDALEIALEALELPKGSEVLVPANSFIASSEAVTRAGYKVVFVDCDSEDYTLSVTDLKSKITDKSSAIMAVHLYGHPCEMDEILSLAKQFSLKVIEDCAQAHGAVYKGRKVGSIGDVAAFSFYPGKNLGAYGDGGAITTNNESLAKKCRMIANHGRSAKYDHQFEGRNSRLDALQAAVLSVKLKHLPDWTQKRIDVADYYLEHLEGVEGLVVPKRRDWVTQVYHLFVVRTSTRDDLKKHLLEHEIQTGVHYPIALPKLEAYEYLNQNDEDMFATQTDIELLSLPIGDHLTTDDLNRVVEGVKSFFNPLVSS